MSLSRRFLLLFPLIGLTLFFGVLGWQNWHLPNDQEEVWLAVASSFAANPQTGLFAPTFPGQEEVPNPFEEGQHVELGLEDNPTQAVDENKFAFEPVPVSLLKEIQSRHRAIRIRNADKKLLTKNGWRIVFGRVEFQDKYTATCSVRWDVGRGTSTQGDFQGGRFVLSRSMLPFGDSKWQVVSNTPAMITTL